MGNVAFADLPERVLWVFTRTGDVVYNAKHCTREAGRYPGAHSKYLAEKAAAAETCLPRKASVGLKPNQEAAIKILTKIYKRLRETGKTTLVKE